MSYKVLALKYRPQTFASVVGQQGTLLALQHALDKNQLHHAYLFTGTRGVGKTTLARILAKSLNCEQGVSSNPCGVCEMCTSIGNNENIDVIEIDAASKTKVEDTRDLLDNVPYSPVRARYKIYIIDEVHMLSNHSFNALLKTLEEPPSHVKFILATTDPQKLPVTVLSRCLQFQLRNLTPKQITDQISQILESEQVAFVPSALPIIAQCANGSMRDALSLLEQVIAFSGQNITVESCKEILGVNLGSQTLELLRTIIAGHAEQAIGIVRELAAANADFNNILKMLQTYIHQLALVQVVPNALADIIEGPALVELAGQVSAVDLQLYYQTALLGTRDLPYAPDIVIGFEMIVLRMIAFRPVYVNDTDTTIAPKAASKKPVPPAPKPTPTPIQAKAIETPPSKIGKVEESTNWSKIVPQLGLSGITKLIADSCTVAKWDADTIVLTLHESQKPLLNSKNVEKLQSALQQYLGTKLRLTVNLGIQDQESPLQEGLRLQQAAMNAAESAIRSDSNIQQLEQTFSAKIVEVNLIEK